MYYPGIHSLTAAWPQFIHRVVNRCVLAGKELFASFALGGCSSGSGGRGRRGGLRLASLLLDPVRQLANLVVDAAALGHQLADLAISVHDRRMVTVPELLADLREREIRELAAQVHGDLPRRHQDPAAAATAQVVDREAEVCRGLGDDHAGADLGLATLGD